MEELGVDAVLSPLKDLCPPPPRPVVPLVTRPVPGEPHGLVVPASHRALTDTYGVGCFDAFLWVFAQGATNVHLDIAEQTGQLRSLFQDKPLPVLDAYRAESGDLVQWGVTDNADLLAWIPVGDPERWPTVIIQAGRLSAVVSDRSSVDIVLGLLTRALRVPFFPDDFPSERPSFSPDPYL
jgi:hypothetical protein